MAISLTTDRGILMSGKKLPQKLIGKSESEDREIETFENPMRKALLYLGKVFENDFSILIFSRQKVRHKILLPPF